MEFLEGSDTASPALLHYDPHETLRSRTRVVLDYALLGASAGAVLSFGSRMAGLQEAAGEAVALLGCLAAIGLKLISAKR